MAIDKKFLNVNILGVSFMLIFTAFQTMGNIEQTVINSIKQDDPSFTGDGFTSLAIIYAAFALANWITPSIITVIGPKFTMFIGSLTYSVFIAAFLFPQTWLLYFTSALLGFGAALIWTGQGNYLTLNSSSDNVSRNSGVFWAELQCSFLFGNLFVFFQFQGRDQIDSATRMVVFIVLLVVGAVGMIGLLILPGVRDDVSGVDSDGNTTKKGTAIQKRQAHVHGPLQAFKRSIMLFFTKDMGLLSVAFFYIGIEFSFLSGVYSTSIGNTLQLEDSKSLVGLSGIFIGVGEIFGGALFGILGSKTNRYGRDPVILLGFLSHAIGFFLIFLNIPDAAPLVNTYNSAFIKSNAIVAMLCSVLVAFGDACFNTQVYSILAGIYPNDSAPAFALFKFVSSVGSAASFLYSSHVGLHIQLAIIAVLAFSGTLCFWIVEWRSVYKRLHTVQKAIPESALSDQDDD